MITGVGVDIVSVERMKRAVERWGERFLQKIFTGDEIKYCYGRSEPYPSLAVRFAAKEALLKAVGGKELSFKDIEVASRPGGDPFIKKQGKLNELLFVRGVRTLHLSLSHEKEFGVAFVVAESDSR